MRNAETDLVPVWSWMWSSHWTGQSDRTVTPNKRREIYENEEFFGLLKQQHCILRGLQFGAEAARGSDGVSNQSHSPFFFSRAAADDRTVCIP